MTIEKQKNNEIQSDLIIRKNRNKLKFYTVQLIRKFKAKFKQRGFQSKN